MKFVVIQSKSQDYIRIHRADCAFAKEPGTIRKTTVWHGPFDSYYEAREFALSFGERVKECTFCNPRNF